MNAAIKIPDLFKLPEGYETDLRVYHMKVDKKTGNTCIAKCNETQFFDIILMFVPIDTDATNELNNPMIELENITDIGLLNVYVNAIAKFYDIQPEYVADDLYAKNSPVN